MESSEEHHCRLCLQILHKNESSYPINFIYKGLTISEHIKFITNVDISINFGNNNIHSSLCVACYSDFESAVKFKTKCEESNIKLQKYYENTHSIKLEVKQEIDDAIDDNSSQCTFPNETSLKNERISEVGDILKIETQLEEIVKDEVFQCYMCKQSFENSQELQLHHVKCLHIFQCDDCGSHFKSKCKLKMHWKAEHLQSKLFCDRCKRHYKTFKAFENHKSHKTCTILDEKFMYIEGTDKDRIFCCKNCSFKKNKFDIFLNHIKIHEVEKAFKCSDCNVSFRQYPSLKRHQDYKHKKLAPLVCDECGKTVLGRRRMQDHMLKHKIPRLNCPICKKSLKQNYLKTHMLRHSDTKSFVCELCALSYYSQAELCTHKRKVHSNVTQKKVLYTCDVCGFVLHDKYAMKKHIKKHSISSHACRLCGKFINDELRLEKHMLRHERGRIYKCDYCDLAYFTSKAKGKHVSKKHADIRKFKNMTNKPSLESLKYTSD